MPETVAVLQNSSVPFVSFVHVLLKSHDGNAFIK